jgi:hypothetical protein
MFNPATNRRDGPYDWEREFDIAGSHIMIKKVNSRLPCVVHWVGVINFKAFIL